MLRRVLLFVVLLGVGLNSVFSLSVDRDIAISLEEKQIQDLSCRGLNLVFYLNLANSSDKTYYLTGYNYRFVVNQTQYFRLNTPVEGGLRIEAAKTTLLALPVKITYELLFQAIPEIAKEDIVACYMMGEMIFSDQRGKKKGEIPFAFNGEIPIFREPGIKLTQLGIKTLTIGGADLDVGVTLTNDNGVPLDIEEIRYNLKFGGNPVKNSQVRGKKTIEPHGEAVFSIPFLLDFFEMDLELRALLQQTALDCQFMGEFGIHTKWGQVVVPFDVTEQIVIVKIE